MCFNKRLITFAVFALLAGTTAGAQSVSGTVKSAGRPVVGTTVRLLELDRSERTGADP